MASLCGLSMRASWASSQHGSLILSAHIPRELDGGCIASGAAYRHFHHGPKPYQIPGKEPKPSSPREEYQSHIVKRVCGIGCIASASLGK